MRVCASCGHKGVPATASVLPHVRGRDESAKEAAAKPTPVTAAKVDPHEARTEVIDQNEIRARMGEIRERMNQMRGTNNAISASAPAVKPKVEKTQPKQPEAQNRPSKQAPEIEPATKRI